MRPGSGGMRLRSIVRGSCPPCQDARLAEGSHTVAGRGPGCWFCSAVFGSICLARASRTDVLVRAVGVGAHFGHAGASTAQFSRQQRMGRPRIPVQPSTASNRRHRVKRGCILPESRCSPVSRGSNDGAPSQQSAFFSYRADIAWVLAAGTIVMRIGERSRIPASRLEVWC